MPQLINYFIIYNYILKIFLRFAFGWKTNTTHPLPHKVVSQVSSQHVRTERSLHHTLVNLKHSRNLKEHTIIVILSFDRLGGLDLFFFSIHH